MTNLKALNVFIPIRRSFESEGRHFVYGYSMLWHCPDMHKTVIAKSVVEKSLSRLMAYPSLRYMHQEPIGKIIFDQEIKGVSTHIDDKGFHVLAEIFPAHNQEWETIKSGNFGFSYGLGFPKTEQQEHNGKFYETFVEGIVYEISIVDSPSCLACNVNTIERYFIPTAKKEQPLGFLGMAQSALSRSVDNEHSDFKEILGRIFRPDEPDFHAKLLARQQQQGFRFFKYHEPPEYPQKTNLEIQEEMKNKKEEECQKK